MLKPRLAALPLLLIAAGCGPRESAPPSQPPSSIETASFAPALEVDLGASQKTASGLYYRDLVVGSGPPVEPGQQIAVHYDGTFIDGTRFDRSGPDDPPFSFRVGNREVIPGWDEGVVGIRVGGKRQLIVPPALAYGPNDYRTIPGNSILVFTVEVVSAQ